MSRTSWVWPAFAIATLLFYLVPLFSQNASIHWDLADVTYPAQKYFEQSLRAGKLPHWTPFLNSGSPFLSDPKVGAWYPLHWPFFAIGITPRAIQWELALHAFLALGGAFLLAQRWMGSATAALPASLFYAWSGFFAGRSSQLAKFEAAALLPWLLWASLEAVESGSPGFVALAGAAGGLIALAGDFPSLVFSILALVLFVASLRRSWKRSLAVVAAVGVSTTLIGAIVILPGFGDLNELAASSVPATGLGPRDLATLFSADYYGVISGLYKGPGELRQFYLYSGLLLAPMSLAGLVRREKLLSVGSLIVPALWFAFGPLAGLYRVLALIPGLEGRTAPIDIWFVAALGLSLLAASGVIVIAEQLRRPHLWIFLLGVTAADLWYWNMYKNPLVYARASYQEIYGRPAQRFEDVLAKINRPAFFRLWAAPDTPGLGPADEPLLSRTEVSYGSGLALLDRYSKYLQTMEGNPKLLSGLAITHGIDIARGTIVENPEPLPRVTAPARIIFVASRQAALEAIKTADPSHNAVVEAPARQLTPAAANLRIANYEGDSYAIQTDAPADFLLKLAVPYESGWRASIDGSSTQVFPVDEALQGVFVPAGKHQVQFWFESPYFRVAIVLAVLGLLLCGSFAAFPSVFSRLFR